MQERPRQLLRGVRPGGCQHSPHDGPTCNLNPPSATAATLLMISRVCWADLHEVISKNSTWGCWLPRNTNGSQLLACILAGDAPHF